MTLAATRVTCSCLAASAVATRAAVMRTLKPHLRLMYTKYITRGELSFAPEGYRRHPHDAANGEICRRRLITPDTSTAPFF